MNLNLTFTTDVAAELAMLSTDPNTNKGRGLALPFGVPSGPCSTDGRRYRFTTTPTNPTTDDRVDVVREHDDDTVVGVVESLKADPTGLFAEARFFDTTAGRDVLIEAREGARRGFSVSAGIVKAQEAADGVIDVIEWTLEHLGVVRRPAFASAGMKFAAQATHHPAQSKDTPMTTPTPAAPDLDTLKARVLDLPEIKALSSFVSEQPTIAELSEKVAEHLGHKDAPAHPLDPFTSTTDFYAAFLSAGESGDQDAAETLSRAFAVPDQTTPNNPGVIPPGWRTDVKANIDRRTPAITAFGRIALPDKGTTVSWPFLDPALDIDTIIKQQMAEKEELQGVPINILKGDLPIKTAGAVSDISYQLLMRSSPSYLAAHNNILMAAWARYCEAKFETQLVALGENEVEAPATTGPALRAQLFAASGAVEDATGSPADIVLVSRDVWDRLGGFEDLYTPRYGTQNATGTSDASTLRVNVHGLEIKRAAFLPANTMIVASSTAAKFSAAGPYIATAEDVRRLGRDVAVWGMYTDGEIYFPNGVRVFGTPA